MSEARTRYDQHYMSWDDQDLFDQLVTWRDEGKFPQLHSVANGKWTLVIDTHPWHGPINERSETMLLHFATEPQNSPQDAIRAALKHLR